ncbi:MAG: hypothetical protein ACE1ZL_07495, partial [Gammaproteobacteria bacterium]
HLTVTNAAQADIKQMPQLLHGEEREIYGDQAYWKEDDRRLTADGDHYQIDLARDDDGNWLLIGARGL